MAEALDVDGDGDEDVLEVGLGLASVGAMAHAVAAGELADDALDAGPDAKGPEARRCIFPSAVTTSVPKCPNYP